MGRKQKYSNSRVISIRVSDVEKRDIDAIMANSRIDKVSDLIREAIRLFKSSMPAELPPVVTKRKQPACMKLS